MLRGIYIAASGLLAESARQDVVANNLANATTTGFKRSEATARPFQEMLLRSQGIPGTPAVGTMTMGAEVQGITRLDTQGPLRHTGNALDVALVGTGYFTVETAAGRRYSDATAPPPGGCPTGSGSARPSAPTATGWPGAGRPR